MGLTSDPREASRSPGVDCELDKVEIGMCIRTSFRKPGIEGPGGIIHHGYKFHLEL